jgi:hypothetical protein
MFNTCIIVHPPVKHNFLNWPLSRHLDYFYLQFSRRAFFLTFVNLIPWKINPQGNDCLNQYETIPMHCFVPVQASWDCGQGTGNWNIYQLPHNLGNTDVILKNKPQWGGRNWFNRHKMVFACLELFTFLLLFSPNFLFWKILNLTKKLKEQYAEFIFFR